ncbi:hypothetical protein NL676_002270 [Syzygium grande]|nr:hypothetical protein NL676_002270 [Syzygium grande]
MSPTIVLSGSIPRAFGDMLALTSINASYNNLEGPLPNVKAFNGAPFEAMQNNEGLCGNVGFTGSKPDQFGGASDDGRQQYSPPPSRIVLASRRWFPLPSELGISGFPVRYLEFLPTVRLNSARCDRDSPWLAPAMERTARTAGCDRTVTSPAIRRRSMRPRWSAGQARGFRGGAAEEIGMAERLTDVFVGGGDGDLLMQRSDREDRVLQALDIQVVGGLPRGVGCFMSRNEIMMTVFPMFQQHIEPHLVHAHLKIRNHFDPVLSPESSLFLLKSNKQVAYQDILKILDRVKICSSAQNFIDIYLRLPGIPADGQLQESDSIRVRICEGRFAVLIREEHFLICGSDSRIDGSCFLVMCENMPNAE